MKTKHSKTTQVRGPSQREISAVVKMLETRNKHFFSGILSSKDVAQSVILVWLAGRGMRLPNPKPDQGLLIQKLRHICSQYYYNSKQQKITIAALELNLNELREQLNQQRKHHALQKRQASK